MLDAAYTFRFNGFSMANGETPAWLVGVGHFRMTPDGKLKGEHRSSTTALKGPGAQQLNAVYRLDGAYTLGPNLTGEARITFTRKGRKRSVADRSADMDGSFTFVGAGDYDRLWLISTTGTITTFGMSADEVIQAEAVRMTQAPRPARLRRAT